MTSEVIDELAVADSTLDLSSGHGRRLELRPACVTAWRILASNDIASVILPADLTQRRSLARAGVFTAAQRAEANLVLDGRKISLAEALGAGNAFPGIDWVDYRGPEDVSDDLGRLRILDDLELPQRRPPAPLPDGRRYLWIDGLKAATALGRDAARFNGDADQVLYEAISNVHRWSAAKAAYACFSVTAGGGEQSFNRAHVVVADNGVGVVASVEERRRSLRLPDWRHLGSIRELASQYDCSLEAALVLHLVLYGLSDREVAATEDGHGLHTSGVLAYQWSGSFDLRTTGPDTEIVVSRTRRGPLQIRETGRVRSRGTLFHVSLEASPNLEEVDSEDLALVSTSD